MGCRVHQDLRAVLWLGSGSAAEDRAIWVLLAPDKICSAVLNIRPRGLIECFLAWLNGAPAFIAAPLYEAQASLASSKIFIP